MVAGPQRRPNPAPLNAHLAPLERALNERAHVLTEAAGLVALDDGTEVEPAVAVVASTKRMIATEFRALAEELKHW